MLNGCSSLLGAEVEVLLLQAPCQAGLRPTSHAAARKYVYPDESKSQVIWVSPCATALHWIRWRSRTLVLSTDACLSIVNQSLSTVLDNVRQREAV